MLSYLRNHGITSVLEDSSGNGGASVAGHGAAGQIRRMPRLFAAQPLNCSPVDASFTAGTDAPVGRPVFPTIAEGTSIAHPLRLPQMIAAVRESGGATVAIPETGIVDALGELCARGLFVEPTSAVAAAVYTNLLKRGLVKRGESTVVLLTGSGLKAAGTVADLLSGQTG